MKIKNTETFAAAVVQSSDTKLSIQEKLDLFLEAKKLADNHNKGISPSEAITREKPPYLP